MVDSTSCNRMDSVSSSSRQAGGRPDAVRGRCHHLQHIAPLELQGRQVDTHHGRGEEPAPLARLAAGFMQHPFAQGNDVAAALSQRDEPARRQQAIRRVLPAHQRLHPDNPAARQIQLGLVVQHKFALARRWPATRQANLLQHAIVQVVREKNQIGPASLALTTAVWACLSRVSKSAPSPGYRPMPTEHEMLSRLSPV